MLAAVRVGNGEQSSNEHPVQGIERLNGAVVVRLVGELDLYNAPEIRTALLEVCAEQPERLVVDLGEVDFVDSTALGVLVEARTRLANRQAFLLAVLPGRDAPHAYDPSGLDQHLSVHDTVESALATPLGGGRSPELSATALLLSGVGADAPARATANGIPAYVDGYATWPRLNRVPIRAGSSAHPGTKNVYASKRKTAARYPVGTIVVRREHRPVRSGSPSWPRCARSRARRTAAGAGRSSQDRPPPRGSRRSASLSQAAPPATRKPSRTTTSSRVVTQRAGVPAPARARASRAAPHRRAARRHQPASP